MGLFPRRPGLFRQSAADGTGRPARSADRYGQRPGAGSNEPLFDPARRPRPEPPAPRPELPVRGGDPSDLLGRSVLAARTQHLCRAYGLLPRGTLSRSYLARDRGLEIAADTHGTITTVFLHFHGDDGFAPYRGEIPGGAGTVPRRAALWAALGRPGESGDPYREKFLGDYGPWDRWELPACGLHAQYALDGESLHRVTLTRPARDRAA
jgi:hypothetical protein